MGLASDVRQAVRQLTRKPGLSFDGRVVEERSEAGA
jgi:hypothetical protein